MQSFCLLMSSFLFFYLAVKCSELEHPLNGKVVYELQERTFRSKAYYVCNDGFDLLGDEYRTCEASGSWSGEEPFCADKEKEEISSFHVKSIVAFLFLIFLFCGFCFRGYMYFLFFFLLVCFIYFKYYFLFFCFVFLFFFLQVLQLLYLLNSLLQLLNLLYSYFIVTFPLIYAIVKCLEAFTRPQRR